MSRQQDRALALGGVFQSARLVHDVAWTGAAEAGAVDATLSSLFRFDAEDAIGVYGGVSCVAVGLRTLVSHLSGSVPAAEAAIMRYALGLLQLERRVDTHGEVWQRLHEGLRQAEHPYRSFGASHENTVAALAGLYADLVSPAGPRILVEGETGHLRNGRNASLIRALLLGGLRSAVLWRQLGATRWALLFRRRRLIDDAEAWLNAL